MVGASNELPESEELDALYDRFLIRKRVGQVSAAGERTRLWLCVAAHACLLVCGLSVTTEFAIITNPYPPSPSTPGLTQLLDYYSGNSIDESDAPSSSGNGAGAGGRLSSSSGAAAAVAFDPSQRLTLKEIGAVRSEAVRSVKVPQHVIQLVADLRWVGRRLVLHIALFVGWFVGNWSVTVDGPLQEEQRCPHRRPQHPHPPLLPPRSYLQDKIEPPVYVSDRRLVKSVALMQVGGASWGAVCLTGVVWCLDYRTFNQPPPPPKKKVAAYCNGRDAVTEYDCLLLEHVLWSTPEVAPKIADWLLAQLAIDDGMKQVGGS
jgi:hypothetical protein